MTTVALTVPAVLLWRQKRSLGLGGTQSLHLLARDSVRSGAPPPSRRRTPAQLEGTKRKSSQDAGMDKGKWPGTASTPSTPSTHTRTLMEPKYPPPRRSGSLLKGSQADREETKSAIQPRGTATAAGATSEGSASLVDGPLMSIGALGIATGAVGLAAAVGIWGVRSMLGVDNVCPFLLLSLFFSFWFSSSLVPSLQGTFVSSSIALRERNEGRPCVFVYNGRNQRY